MGLHAPGHDGRHDAAGVVPQYGRNRRRVTSVAGSVTNGEWTESISCTSPTDVRDMSCCSIGLTARSRRVAMYRLATLPNLVSVTLDGSLSGPSGSSLRDARTAERWTSSQKIRVN